MKEGQLRFEFVHDKNNNSLKIVTYTTNGKDAEWIKVNRKYAPPAKWSFVQPSRPL
jgi:hypothetical protein